MRFSKTHLETVSREFLIAIGASSTEAEMVARSLVQADMRGIHTHGVNFLPKIAMRIADGVMTIPTEPKVISDREAICHIDGNNGFGQIAAAKGMQCAIEHASQFGVGMTFIRNTNHIGLLAQYSTVAAENGMIGFAMCNSAPSVAPWGGLEPFFGTNPFSVAAPSGEEHPIVLDMSTTVVARGKIRQALKNGNEIPADWAFGPDGRPTKEPKEAMKGTLVPIGGAKGYGMAFFIDLMCGLLPGSSFSREVLTFHKSEGPTGVGAMMCAIDIQRLMPLSTFQTLVKSHVGSIRDSKKAEGNVRIYLPGEIEAYAEQNSEADGIDIDEKTVAEIDSILEEKGVELRLKQQVPR